jgi:hypothetical protein
MLNDKVFKIKRKEESHEEKQGSKFYITKIRKPISSTQIMTVGK